MATTPDSPPAGTGTERAGALPDSEHERQLLAWRLDLLARWAGDMVFLVDDQLRMVDGNDRALELLGYGREELLSLHVADLRDPAMPNRLQERLDELRTSGRARWETRFRRKDGTTFPVEAEVHLARWDGRDWLHAVVRDLSERERSEAALLASEVRFRAAFDGVPIGMALIDRSGRFLETNRAMQAIVDQGEEALRGRPALELVHPDDADAARDAFLQLRQGGPLQLDIGCRHRRRDGTYAETRLRMRTLADAGGAFRYALAVVEDVSERRAAWRPSSCWPTGWPRSAPWPPAWRTRSTTRSPSSWPTSSTRIAELAPRRGRVPEVVAALEEAREGGAARPGDRPRPEDLLPRRRRRLASGWTWGGCSAPPSPWPPTRCGPAPGWRWSSRRRRRCWRQRAPARAGLPQPAHQRRPGHPRGRRPPSTWSGRRAGVHARRPGPGRGGGRRRRHPARGPEPHLRPLLHHQAGRGRAPGSASPSATASWPAGRGDRGGERSRARGPPSDVLLPARAGRRGGSARARAAAPARGARVLVVDDEPLVRRALQRVLSPPHHVRVHGERPGGPGRAPAPRAASTWSSAT